MKEKKVHEIKVKTLNYSVQLFFNSEKTTFSANILFETETNSSNNLELWQQDNEALGKLMKEKFNPIAFHDSLLMDGEHCTFTCGCDVPSCAGFEPCTLVKKDKKEISWLIKNRYYEEDIQLILDRSRCEEILKDLIKKLNIILNAFPQAEESVYGGKQIKELIKILKSDGVHYNFKRVSE
ncbi:MAG: hypothetical protein AABX34_01695 [Nanoarchaeota archaeon]